MSDQVDDFFKAISGGASYRKMGSDSGIGYSTVRRQLTGEGDLTAGVVVALARAYGANVIEALKVAGFITAAEAGRPSLTDALRNATDVELAEEILRRALAGEATEALTGPIAPVIVGSFGHTDDPVIPENAEEVWGSAAYSDTDDDPDPEDHTP